MEPLNDDDDDGFDASFLEVSLSEPTSAGSGLGKHINYKMTVRVRRQGAVPFINHQCPHKNRTDDVRGLQGARVQRGAAIQRLCAAA